MTEALWHLQTLEERLDYLQHRLADRTTPGKKAYTRAEHAAIEWALKILKPPGPRGGPVTFDTMTTP